VYSHEQHPNAVLPLAGSVSTTFASCIFVALSLIFFIPQCMTLIEIYSGIETTHLGRCTHVETEGKANVDGTQLLSNDQLCDVTSEVATASVVWPESTYD